MATWGYFGGKSHSHPRLVFLFKCCLSISLGQLSCLQISNTEKERDSEKDKEGNRPAKLNGKKATDGYSER